jgi:polar amino acid transport system substrate-binding protein
MRRIALSTLALLVVASLGLAACGTRGQPAPSASGESLTDLGGREIIVAVENAYPPFNYLDQDGNGIGYDYDLLAEICERANCKPTFKEFAWEGMFEAAQAGEFDISCDGISVRLDRGKVIDFSDPLMEYGKVLVVRADETAITDITTLQADSEALVGVQLDTTNEATIQKYIPTERILSFDDFPTAITALIAGDVDVVPLDTVAAVGYLKENPDKLKVLEEPLTSGEFIALIMTPASPIRTAVDAALNEMWADGTMDELYQKWFTLE